MVDFDPYARTTTVELGAPEDDDEELVGRTFDDRFEIRSLLGAGAHGAVYEAWDQRHGCSVALKTLLRVAPDELVRFKREFRILSDVSHPNLVTLHELFVGASSAYLTMELVHGTDFLTWVRGEDLDALDDARLRDAMRQLARGLSALHDYGLLHRDLKPSNVLVDNSGKVLVADFGLARPLFSAGPSEGLSGTPAYMSPEQAADLDLDAASDWYSVGVMLYEALTGGYPFGGLSGMGLMMAKQLQSAGPPSLNEPAVPVDLDALCEQLLAREPKSRPGAPLVLDTLGVSDDAGAPAGRGAPPDDELFVGRVQELSQLESAWALIRDAGPLHRRAIVLLVDGPSGGGKSALLRRFVGEIESSSVVLRGRCYERESVAYKGLDDLIDALRAYLLSPDGAIGAVDLPGAGALARLFPVLQDVPGIGDRALVPIEDPLEQRRQAVDALRELLRRLASVRPLLVMIDDLQWCDGDTASVLVELLRPLHRPPFLFIASYRSDEDDHGVLRELDDGLRKLEALPVQTLRLEPLDVERATELAELLLDGEGEPGIARGIATEAEGNPLFVAELVRHARSGGRERNGGSLEAVVTERARHLSETARRVLELVATAQRPTPQSVILGAAHATTGGMEAIALLRAQAFVRTHGPEPTDAIEPFHARIGAAIALNIAAERRVAHHGSLAKELEHTGVDAEELAFHLAAAGDSERALGYLDTASVDAQAALAFERAARLCETALELALPDDPRRPALWRRLADALAYDGRGVRAAEAYRAAAEGAPKEQVVELRRAAAEQLLRCGRLEEGQAELRRVLAEVNLHAPDGPKAALAGLLGLRARIRMRGTEFDERSQSEVDPETLLAIDTTWTAATGMLQSNVMFGQYFQGRHLLLALEGGEPHRVARALAMEGLYTATGGTKATVQTDLLNEQLSGLSRRLDDPRALAASLLAAGVADLYRGRFAAARPQLERAAEIYRRQCTNVHWEMAMVRLFLVLALYYVGDLPAMRQLMADSLQDADDRDDLYTQLMLRASFEPLLLLFDDDVDGARRVFDDLCTEHAVPLQTATYRYSLMLTVSRLERYAGRGQQAWEPFGEHWAAVRRSLMLIKQPFKIFSLHDRAVGAMAAARDESGSARRALLARARRDCTTLLGEGTRWSRSMALPISASLAAERGETQTALLECVAAERAFAESGLQLYRLSMRRRRGECVSGTEGDALTADADAKLVALGVVAPARLAAMLVPTVCW